MLVQPVSEGKAAGDERKLTAVPEFNEDPLAVTSSGSLVYRRQKVTSDSLVAEVDLERATLGKTVFTRPSQGLGRSGLGGGVRFSPDGKRVLFTLPQKTLLIRSLEDGSEYTILPQLAAFARVEWAADSTSLLVAGTVRDGRNGLYRVDLRSGTASLLAAGPFGNFAPALDGKRVYCYRGGLSVIDLETGAAHSLGATTSLTNGYDMKLSHDGGQLAIFREGGVAIVDAGTGALREAIRARGHYLGGDWSPDDRFLITTWGYHDTPTELVKLPVEGGPPTKTVLPAHYRGVRLSPDGKRVAMTRWNEHHQIWVLENFLPAAAGPSY